MYDEENGAAEVDLTNVDEVEKLVRDIAKVICDEQPDMPEPQSLADMDSFSVIQMLLQIENATGRKLLEKFESYSFGEEFRDLATHIVAIVKWENEHPNGEEDEAGDAPAAAVTDGSARA
jgi:hypothetical protein